MTNSTLMMAVVMVEERLNRRLVKKGAAGSTPWLVKAPLDMAGAYQGAPPATPLSAGAQRRLDEAFRRRRHAASAADYVLSLLPERGFALDDGQPDCVRFYKQAWIAPDVWSTFLSHTHAPSKTTLFRIVFALKLDEAEAQKLLSLAGSGFSSTNLTDQLVLACIDCGIYDPAVVYDVFDFYRTANAAQGKEIRNIYSPPR